MDQGDGSGQRKPNNNVNRVGPNTRTQSSTLPSANHFQMGNMSGQNGNYRQSHGQNHSNSSFT